MLQGRILADAMLYNVIEQSLAGSSSIVNSKIVIETDISAVEVLKKYLTAYRLRSARGGRCENHNHRKI